MMWGERSQSPAAAVADPAMADGRRDRGASGGGQSTTADYRIRPCTPEDLRRLARAVPVALLGRLETGAESLCDGFAGVCIVAGRPVVACGIVQHWASYGEGWALVDGAGGVPIRLWPAITAACIAGLDRAQGAGMRLVEATVRADFAAGHRWARRLGFTMACPRPFWGADGGDGMLYQRVRGGG